MEGEGKRRIRPNSGSFHSELMENTAMPFSEFTKPVVRDTNLNNIY